MNKKGFETSFSWIFALIAGGVILFLAIYISSQLISTGQEAQDLKGSKDLGIILNPLETGVESQTGDYFIMPVETRIWNKCSVEGDFGEQGIQIQQKSFNKWSNTESEIEFKNKYIFSDEIIEGEKFFVFSKPFQFPFKVSDVMIITSDKEIYCFENPPSEIERDLEMLEQNNIIINDCDDNSLRVCFNGNSCDIVVNVKGGYVERDGEKMYFYGDALMYSAIFSEPEVYECQTERLMKRVKSLSKVYEDKENYLKSKECSSNIGNELISLSNSVSDYEGSVMMQSAYLKSLVE